MNAQWKRIHVLPNRWSRALDGWNETPRSRYIYLQSLERYKKRADSLSFKETYLTGEVGRIDGTIIFPF